MVSWASKTEEYGDATMSLDTIGSSVYFEDALEAARVGLRCERGVDLLGGGVAAHLHDQVHDRARGHRRAHGDAVELASSSGITSPIALAAPVRSGSG